LGISSPKIKELSDQHFNILLEDVKSSTTIEKLPAWNKGVKGLRHSPKTEFKRGHTPWNKGKSGCYTKEQLQRLSDSHKGNASPRKGKTHTEEAKRKMSESSKGQTAWNKGKIMSKEFRTKRSELVKGKIWVNNGVETKHVQPEYIPEGFSRGRLKLNKSPSRNDD